MYTLTLYQNLGFYNNSRNKRGEKAILPTTSRFIVSKQYRNLQVEKHRIFYKMDQMLY